MTPREIADKAEELRIQQSQVPPPTMSNYHAVLMAFMQINSDQSVLIRELARWAIAEDEKSLPPQTD
jgi:hypothetical protein